LALFERQQVGEPLNSNRDGEFEIVRESDDGEPDAAIEGVDAVFDLLAAEV
jgi:hypothetical protein